MGKQYSTRELFKRIINFQDSPRTLKWEFGYWGETVLRSYKEGLQPKSNIIDYIEANSRVIGLKQYLFF